jgi:hypothetical protein
MGTAMKTSNIVYYKEISTIQSKTVGEENVYAGLTTLAMPRTCNLFVLNFIYLWFIS